VCPYSVLQQNSPGRISSWLMKSLIDMASVGLRGLALCAVCLLNTAFVFISGAEFIRFISFRAIYHNITGDTTLCQGKRVSLLLAADRAK